MRALIIDVPAPCAWINSNDRKHRMAAAKLTSIWRNAGTAAVLELNRQRKAAGEGPAPTFMGRVRIVAKIFKPKANRFDPNNLHPTTKAIVDGLVQAGLLIDDDHKHVLGPDHRYGGKGEPRIVLTIEEAP
jgi:hypothetical protein